MHPALQGSSCVQGYGLGGPTGGCPTASAITCTCEHLGKKESYLKAEPYQSECETHTEWLSYPVSLLSLCLWVENGESVSVPWKARCPQVQCNVNGTWGERAGMCTNTGTCTAAGSSPHVSAHTLQRWLCSGQTTSNHWIISILQQQ